MTQEPPRRSPMAALQALEIDTRLLGLIVATLAIWVVFNLVSDGLFLTPRNLWNLSVQSAAVAIMATGMVLIIVSRNIDLSIGSTLGFTGMFMAMIQAEWLPKTFGLGLRPALHLDHRAGLRARGGRGHRRSARASSSRTSACRRSSSRSAACSSGAASRSSSRRARRSRQWTASSSSWAAGPRGRWAGRSAGWSRGIAIVGIIYSLWASRRRRRKYGFPVRPMWADVAARDRRVPR